MKLSLGPVVLGALAALSFVATGCAAQHGDASETTAAADTVNQSSGDVTIAQAWIGKTVGRRYESGYVLGDLPLDLSRCSGNDCGSAAASLFDSKLVGGFRYDKDYSGQCETIEIRTLTRRSAFDAPSFRGIGIYISGRYVYVEKSGSGEGGEYTLSSGQKAIEHKLVVQGECFGLGGNGGSLYRRSYEFKPYVTYAGSDGNVYNNWDDVASNYFLGRREATGQWVSGFDRRGDALNR